ncbi:MAG: phosphotransferase [Akkermansia sp.]|nr:phosphotransferase [Akkermansia sp.]
MLQVSNRFGILSEAIQIIPCHARAASHFVLNHQGKIKYIIDLSSGTSHLQNTIAAYNRKLAYLIKMLPCIPWKILRAVGLGYFANIKLHPHIQLFIPHNNLWNLLVGTYDEAQKLVFQCFLDSKSPCTFIKVGNAGSDIQMQREIDFLKHAVEYTTFRTPVLLNSSLLREGAPFNVLVTKEFTGKKVLPILTETVYRVAKEIAGPTLLVNGKPHTFSHGDFAPWNIRKQNDSYIVFDWEHCGVRPEGYDIAYFIIMTEIALRGSNFEKAFNSAKKRLQQLEPNLNLNRNLIFQEFIKTTKTLNF